MRFGSLFAGILGWDLALEAHGHTTAWASEIDTHCRNVIAARRPSIELLGDVREIDAGAPKVDGLFSAGIAPPYERRS